MTISPRSDTDSITFEDVLAALASIADAMMLVRAVADEAVSELIFIPANTLLVSPLDAPVTLLGEGCSVGLQVLTEPQ